MNLNKISVLGKFDFAPLSETEMSLTNGGSTATDILKGIAIGILIGILL